ncbi:MAG: response regulator transcription factor [Thaumarchaeota archaeon]|nr:response regulator transcription factor [Nitrososphaerota archaeon]
MKILIIDDNQDITEMLSRYLSVKGFDCVTTNDGLNGLNLIKKEKYDTVFLDISMPDFGGMDVIAALEKENMLKDQRIVIFTASSITNEQLQTLLEKDGVESCLKKPVQLSELITTITVGN